jgi:hypothetical protein
MFYNFFCNVLTKTGYFNTGFVFLRYKNTNQFQAKWYKKYVGKLQSFFFGKDFLIFLIGLRLGRTQNRFGLWPTRIQPTIFWVGLNLATWAELMIQPMATMDWLLCKGTVTSQL